MTNWTKPNERESGFVEVLATRHDGIPFGYRFQGHRSGPQLVVAGLCPSAAGVFDRIIQIPTLPWMRGTLTLIMLDAFNDLTGNENQFDPLGPIDRTIMLPAMVNGSSNEGDLKRHYHTVLSACAALGMISGRGVPQHNRIGVTS